MDWMRATVLIGVILFTVNYCNAEGCEDELDFMCTSDKKCIKSELMCDHKYDCDDHSDEEDCDCLAPDWYLCKDNQTCISYSARCDGHYDCPSDDDEMNCAHYVPHHEQTVCSKDEFKCTSDGTCLPLDIVCDGTKHCFDGSDEDLGCKELNTRCQGFHCKNGRCLTDSEWLCDGVNDCGDNSDEQNCTYNCNAQNDRFLCADNVTCIPLKRVCDGIKDCSGGDDETDDCFKQKTKKICSKQCEPNGSCVNLPSGQTCVCPKGFKFNDKKQECEDINECLEFGTCSQGCVNTRGSYNCTCAPQFRLLKNNHTCTAFGSGDAILLYAASKTVNWYSLKSRHMKRVAENLNQVIGVSYDGDHVYWTDISVQVESIMKSKKDGSELKTVFTAGLGKPEDVAVDYITGNIYFTDNDFQHVAVCNNDARYCKAIITENVHRPRGIVLYPQKGKLYWTDWGINPMIAVASMDGSSNQKLVSKDITWPNGLTLDWPNERIYWVDAKYKTIESCKLDGSDRRQVIKEISKHPYGIAVFQDSLYWSDWDSKSIQSCNKFTGKNRTTIIRDSVIYDIHVYHPALQASTKNLCHQSDCSHLCLLNSNSSYTCACPKYMELTVDKHTCRWTGKQKILMIGIGHRLVRFEHQSFGRHEDGEGKTLRYQIDKMAYNSITGDIIVADNLRKVIVQVKDDFSTKLLISESIGEIAAMTFDELANNLYWADAIRSTIEVYSFNTQHRAVVQHFMGEGSPIALVAITEVGKLFVALRSNNHTHIDMVAPNGRGPHFHVIEEDLGDGPIAMIKDHDLNEVFWADSSESRISYTDYNGEMHHTFLYDVNSPVSLAVVGDDMFWTTSKSLKLNWTPKHSYLGTKSMHVEHPVTSPTPMSMELLTITTQTVSNHPCAQHGFNGGCSHICVAMGKTSHACLCTPGTVFRDAQNTTCVPSEECGFRCGSGECIVEAERCDGFKNCQDSSDEVDCNGKSKHVTCASNEFTCLDGSKCIDRKLRCNKIYDCDDSSDEMDCKGYDPTTKCHEHQFVCHNGACMDPNSLCDGFKDCETGEDELETNCRQSRSRTCNAGEFKCSNNQCIPNAWVCDGALDCSNDEDNCAPEKCADNMMQCEHGTCISKELWCDGTNDCGDFSDEADCKEWGKKVEIVCDDSETKMFQCKNNKTICLDMSKRCNGYADCPKGEDELDCDTCTESEFKCGLRECIPIRWRCDNHKDCKDGSDELKCNGTTGGLAYHYVHPVCSDDEFLCKNGECVDWDRVCDTHNDCKDGSDEGANCANSCKNSPCEQVCNRSPNGPSCSCHDGYSLNADKKSCSDIDECKIDSPCAQICENTKGSYRCSCFSGFALSYDKMSCKSTDSQMSVFYSSFDKIYRLNHITLTSIKSTNDSKIVGLDMHFDKKMLYFTIEDSGTLYEFNYTHDSAAVNTVKNIGMPTHVAVDWITDNVYFIDKSVAVKVCHMEKRKCITLIEFQEGEHIKSLAVDAVNHRLFYAIVKKFEFTMPESKIIAHRLDGSQRKEISKDSFFVPSITCDFYTERVYYVGLETKTIWSVRYDGTGKKLMIAHNPFVTRPIEITMLESRAYVSNAGSKIVASCAMYGNRRCVPHGLNSNQVDNLVIAHKSRQKSAENLCENDKCNTICTPSDVGAKCICDFGETVGAGVECMTKQQNSPLFHQPVPEEDSGSTVKTIFGTLFIITLLIALVAGGLFVYKRFYAKKPHTISMHFENPQNSTIEAARVKMCKLNEIMINRQHNNNNNNNSKDHRGGIAPPSTMIEEQEINEYSTATTSDDTQKLLL